MLTRLPVESPLRKWFLEACGGAVWPPVVKTPMWAAAARPQPVGRYVTTVQPLSRQSTVAGEEFTVDELVLTLRQVLACVVINWRLPPVAPVWCHKAFESRCDIKVLSSHACGNSRIIPHIRGGRGLRNQLKNFLCFLWIYRMCPALCPGSFRAINPS